MNIEELWCPYSGWPESAIGGKKFPRSSGRVPGGSQSNNMTEIEQLKAEIAELTRRAEFLEQLLKERAAESKQTNWKFDGKPVSFTEAQEKIAMGYMRRNGLVPPDDDQGTPVTYPEDLRLNDNLAHHPTFGPGYRQELHRSRAASEKPLRDAFHKWVEKVTKRNDKNT
jgi:hypothetical protein